MEEKETEKKRLRQESDTERTATEGEKKREAE